MRIFSSKPKGPVQSRLDIDARVAAIDRSQAVIEVQRDGAIIDANQNVLTVLGYSLSEIQRRRHSMFVGPEEAGSPAHQAFWNTLRGGQFVATKFKRIGKGGRVVWIQASYNPIWNAQGERTEAAAQREASEQAQHTVVEELTAGLKRLAERDLTALVVQDFPGRYQQIKTDFNAAAQIRGRTATPLAEAPVAPSEGEDFSGATFRRRWPKSIVSQAYSRAHHVRKYQRAQPCPDRFADGV